MRAALVAAGLLSAFAQQPEQAHLSLTGSPSELSLDFMAHEANCSVGYGAQLSTSPDFSAAAFVPASSCVDFTADEAGRLTLAVTVLFTGLVAGTKYYYVCGSEALRTPWSRVYSFTHDTGAARDGGATAVVIADFGYYNAESLEKLYADAFTGRFDALLHAGDFSYDFDTDGGHVGDGYMRQLEPVTSAIPYNGIPGNHEVANNYTHYKTRFASVAAHAGVRSGSFTNMFYSVDQGLAHYIFIDTEAYWSQPVDSQTAMENWLAADLAKANANRAAVPWVIGLGHKTWWCVACAACSRGLLALDARRSPTL